MSNRAIARTPRTAFLLACAAVLLAPSGALAAPASAAIAPSTVLAAAGQITPIALGPGQPSANHAVFAQPFRTLDPGALRAAKLRAAAIASRGSRGPGKPSSSTLTPLSSFFNNLNRPGLSNYIEMVNQSIGVYDRSLNQVSSTDNGSFMGTGSGTSVSDPQIQWDGQ